MGGGSLGFFNNCYALKGVFLKSLTVTSVIYNAYGIFANCSSLKYIFCPSLVTQENLVVNCDALQIVDCGKNISSLPRGSYRNDYTDCPSNQINLVFRNATPPTLAANFGATPKYIFVPTADAVTAYQAADYWKNYSSIIKAIGGEEWVSVFGSEDEYADVAMYAPDDYDEIVAAYENA